MKRRQFFQTSAAVFVASVSQSGLIFSQTAKELDAGGMEEDPIAGPAKGPWRRLFLDGAVTEFSQGLSRIFHAAKKSADNPVVRRDQTWEGVSAITGPYVYGTVMWQGDKLRMWYQFLNHGNHVGYAESRDGIHWTKPALEIVKFDGSRANNIVVSAFDTEATGGQCHNPSVIRRPSATNPDERYVLFGFDGSCGHPRAAFSSDGLHWRYDAETQSKPLFNSSDVLNFCYDPYRARYFATWKTRNRRGRAVGVAWSKDGRTWSKPFDGPVFAADDLDPDATQIYGMPAFPYQGMYIGLPWIYNARYFRYGDYTVEKLHEAQQDSPRTIDVQLAWSWDLINWTRSPQRDQFIARGATEEWDGGMIVTARAPVKVGDELYFYYGGCQGVHDQPRVSAAIGLAKLRVDGFCSMRAAHEEGFLITRREPFRKPAVTINAKTAPSGMVTAEILNRHNEVIPGFGREDCLVFRGDSVNHLLKWKSEQFQTKHVDEDYKFRFWLKDAELFSYLPSELDPDQPDLARVPNSGP